MVAGHVVDKLRNNKQFGLVAVGIVDDDLHDVGSPELPWLGRFADLDKIIAAQEIDRVIIAFSRASHEQLLEAIRASRDAGVAVDIVPRLFEFLDGVRALDQVGGLPLLSIGAPMLTSVSMAAKRALDVFGSLALILVFAPLMIPVAIAVKLESRGPVFFRQPRAGRRNSSFRLIKFRSMYLDAEERKKELEKQNEADDGVMFKIRDDPRVTRVGRFIRRFSLDELPQLFNVLRGEMSLVGPRPLIFPETAALEEQWHLRRLELRPGITGPWQVYGRSQSPFQEMVRFDYQYVAGWSLARDVEILLATVPAVLSGRGAY
jgi:exopolysaccharide biosynthesis polyprenyl glycosylphosphotransferase